MDNFIEIKWAKTKEGKYSYEVSPQPEPLALSALKEEISRDGGNISGGSEVMAGV